jgi:hypothetical protein
MARLLSVLSLLLLLAGCAPPPPGEPAPLTRKESLACSIPMPCSAR